VITEARRAGAAFALADASGTITQSGEAEALIADDALTVGPLAVSFLDADFLRAGDYRIELTLWPEGRLTLTHLGRRFDTFTRELGRARNQARVAGLLAHGIAMPDVFSGAVLSEAGSVPSEIQVYDTHVTVIPADADPWQVPLGAVTVIRAQDDPPAVVLETSAGPTILGHLARRRDACRVAITERWEAQRQILVELAGQSGFSDGWGVARAGIREFDQLLNRFTAPERVACRNSLLAAATGDPALGFVQLLDPDAERRAPPADLPENMAVFLLVPVGALTVLEVLAGPAAATYVFRDAIDAVNRDLQLLHLRRAPLALTTEQAELAPSNPYRLALRRLEPLRRLRTITTARLIHNEGWQNALGAALSEA